MKLLGNRLLVESRGYLDEDQLVESTGIVIPKHHFVDSNVCTTSDGQTIMKKNNSGIATEKEHEYIINTKDIIAKLEKDDWKPFYNYYLVRKCEDPQDEGGIKQLGEDRNNFAEILAVGPDCGTKNVIGDLAYVDIDHAEPQKVEDTEHDWLVLETDIPFIVGD